MKNIKTLKVIYLCALLSLCFNIGLYGYSIKLKEEYNRASILIDKNQYKKAISVYQDMLKSGFELSEHMKSRIYNNLGYCYYKLKNLEDAYRFYTKALEIDGSYFFCLNNISAVLIKQKKYQEALPYLNRAFDLDKEYIKVVFNLFVVQANLKSENLAEYYLKKAFEIDKDYTIERLRKNNISDKQIEKIIKRLDSKENNDK